MGSNHPPANYAPHTVDVLHNPLGIPPVTKLLSFVCTVVALLIIALLWCIGIPTKADLK